MLGLANRVHSVGEEPRGQLKQILGNLGDVSLQGHLAGQPEGATPGHVGPSGVEQAVVLEECLKL